MLRAANATALLRQRKVSLHASQRAFSTEKKPNLIQMMPEYQDALHLAVEKKY
jgi:hypothetical protein